MYLNCVNGAVVAQHTARQNSILLSSVAKQRAKEIASNGESSIRKVRPTPLMKVQQRRAQQSCPSPISSKKCIVLDHNNNNNTNNTNSRDKADSDATALTASSSKEDAITRIKNAIAIVKANLVEIVEKRDMNMKLATLRYKETKEKTSPPASRIVAILIMDRVSVLNARIHQVGNIIVGLEELMASVMDDVVYPNDIEDDINEIVSLLRRPPKNVPKYTDDELIQQLEGTLQGHNNVDSVSVKFKGLPVLEL